MNPIAVVAMGAAAGYMAVCTAARLRSRSTRTTQVLLIAGILTTGAFTVVNPGVYEGVSALLGSPNAADPLSKILLLIAVALTGHQFASASNAVLARKTIAGVPGVVAFAAAVGVMAVTFPAVEAPYPSPFLLDFLDQPAAKAYTMAALGYLAFVAALLCPGALRIARIARTQAHRNGARLLAGGFALAIVRAPLELFTTPVREQLFNIVSCASAVSVAAGLACFARHRRQNPPRATAYVKSYLAEEKR